VNNYIRLRITWSGRNYRGRKDSGNPISPIVDTSKKGQTKEEQGIWGKSNII